VHYDILLNLIEHYGYLALFFALWLGIVGMPIPDEAIVMTGGLVTTLGLLNPIPAFILTYMGVISGLSLGYILGNRIGVRILNRIIKNKQSTKRYIFKSQDILEKFGQYALVISYFLPVVRHLMPYLVGIGKMPYPKYALYSYSTGLIWTLIYFFLGRLFGDHIEQLGILVEKYGWYTLGLSVIVLVVLRLYHYAKPSPTD
jgi:membrane-associated protein